MIDLNPLQNLAARPRAGCFLALLLLASLPAMTVAHAATIIWTNTAGGNWSGTNNWSPNQVPGSNDTANVTVAGTYAITLDANANLETLALGGAVSGVQTLQASGFTLVATNAAVNLGGILGLTSSTLAGAILVNQGTIQVSGGASTINVDNFTNLATLSVEDGTLQLQGGQNVLEPSGTLSVGLDSLTDYGTFDLPGNATLTGTLEVRLNNGYVPAPGSSFAVLSCGSAISGSFTNFNYVPPVVIWRPVYGSNALTLVAYPAISLFGTNVAINLAGTPLQQATLITATNLNVPLHDWTPVATNTFDVTRFLSFTNGVNSSNPAQFFALQPTYTIGGTISGLTPGDVVILNDNGGDDLMVTTNGSFTFATPLPYGSRYYVSGGSSSEGAFCVITNKTGTIGTSNITNVVVTCSPIHECKSGFDPETCHAMEVAGCTNVGTITSPVWDCNDNARDWLQFSGPNGTGCSLHPLYGGNCNSAGVLLH